jgi:hypothetical protein
MKATGFVETLWPICQTKRRYISEEITNLYESLFLSHKRKYYNKPLVEGDIFLLFFPLEKITGYKTINFGN